MRLFRGQQRHICAAWLTFLLNGLQILTPRKQFFTTTTTTAAAGAVVVLLLLLV